MTPQQIELIQASWVKVGPIADTAAGLFCDRLFEMDPDMRTLFRRIPTEEQGQKLVQGLDNIVKGLTQFEAFQGELKALGRRHAAFGMLERQYDTVGAALVWSLERGLGDIWTDRLRDAWIAAFTTISRVMRDGASEGSAPKEASHWPGNVPGWRPSYNKFWL
ncbi:hemin receptor [Sneathiella chungangensis]|uniref:Hemin receptor n=1 Tax=Sneathiella chungangensis TaxID=1418234 RepID=A0A845MEE9_9PROT|nr:globin family protein [Sneathiella chungangensis]MZR21414.1 hemin receptor [Sneathiella chungangensis]